MGLRNDFVRWELAAAKCPPQIVPTAGGEWIEAGSEFTGDL